MLSNFEYLLSFQNSDECLDDERLDRKVLTHIINFNKVERVFNKDGKRKRNRSSSNKRNDKEYEGLKASKSGEFDSDEKLFTIVRRNSKEFPLFQDDFKKGNMEKWARMDISNEIHKAVENVVKIKTNLNHLYSYYNNYFS